MARFEIKNEVPHRTQTDDDWTLHFQFGTYHYDEGEPSQDGYRFIWRRPDGSLQAARGQARIPGSKELEELLDMAKKEGWY